MKLLDEKKRLFGIMNPVDLVAIVLAVAIVVLLATVLFGNSPTAPVTGDAQGTVEVVMLGSVQDLDEIQYELGEEASRVGGQGVMGELVELEVTPARREIFLDDGTSIITESSIAREVRIVLRGEGSITADGASIGMQRVWQNEIFDVQFPHFKVSARVLSITQVD